MFLVAPGSDDGGFFFLSRTMPEQTGHIDRRTSFAEHQLLCSAETQCNDKSLLASCDNVILIDYHV
jgi:hypothetical protein